MFALSVEIAQTRRSEEPTLTKHQLHVLMSEDVSTPGVHESRGARAARDIEQKIECAIVSGDLALRQRVGRDAASVLHLLRDADPRVHMYACRFIEVTRLNAGDRFFSGIQSPRELEQSDRRRVEDEQARRMRTPLPWTTCDSYDFEDSSSES